MLTGKMILAALNSAWDMLVDLPGLFKNEDHNETPEDWMIQLGFPVVGVVVSLILLLAGYFISLIAAKIAAAVIFALVMCVATELRDSARGLSSFSSFVELKAEKHSIAESLLNMSSQLTAPRGTVGMMTLILTIIFKFCCFGLIFYYNHYFWLMAVIVLGYAVQGELAASAQVSSGMPILNVEERKGRYFWTLTIFFMFFILFKAPTATLFGFAVAFLLALGWKKYCHDIIGGVTGNIINFAGYVCELAILLLGIIFLS